jgi:hypothetical protein
LEKEISKRIVDELLTYFYSLDITDIRIGLDFSEEGFFAEFQGVCAEQPYGLDKFARILETPRDPSIDSYYQELLGNMHHVKEDYYLLGSLIDDIEIMYDQPQLNIKIFRHK